MIYGNEKEQNLVKEWLESEKRGALLIFGPEGVGKFSFVKEILKDKKNEWEHIILKSDKKIFSIDSARFIGKITLTKPKNKRIILIDEMHKFREESQNVLLKTIEEPVSDTLFVFVSHQKKKILPTIRSRSLEIKFSLVPQELTLKFLKEKNFSETDIDFSLSFFPYQPGKAYHLIKNKQKITFYKNFYFQATSLEKIELLRNVFNYFDLEKNLDFNEKINKIYKEIIELLILKKRKELIEKAVSLKEINQKHLFEIKDLLELYSETDQDYNWFLQLTNLILSYG
ncbi:MAG: AAA family ATPase [Candidatus Pacebacteria bacterium]|jgi:hypothetical protein|nr:AAA family ATPase [Candidatus Paceibacterota bacterium]